MTISAAVIEKLAQQQTPADSEAAFLNLLSIYHSPQKEAIKAVLAEIFGPEKMQLVTLFKTFDNTSC
jgi:hypothetical protein